MHGQGYWAIFLNLALFASSNASAADKPSLKIEVASVSDHKVKFVVVTTLPPPVEVIAEVSLAGQKLTDTYIGYDEKVWLDNQRSVFVLDTAKHEKPLPNAKYEVTVTFYPKWGASRSPAAAGFPILTDTKFVILKASGLSRASAVRKEALQRWIMSNVFPDTPWDESDFVKRLGPYRESSSTLSRLHAAYYFPAADMTLIVNRARREVSVWREGKATQ